MKAVQKRIVEQREEKKKRVKVAITTTSFKEGGGGQIAVKKKRRIELHIFFVSFIFDGTGTHTLDREMESQPSGETNTVHFVKF
jgi:hypothetical protein